MAVSEPKRKRLFISVCIATHERARLLATTLGMIACQIRQADEIVISDSSTTQETEDVVSIFQHKNPGLVVRYIKSECKALPWHRWNGFQHSKGDIVLFLDDDIGLASDALQKLERAYLELYDSHGIETVAGVGFYTVMDDGSEKLRRSDSFEERWLGISNLPSASITSGGLGVPITSMSRNALIEVSRLSGGRMSFRRDVLTKVGYLDRLVDLYVHGVGRGEDTVLSYYAGRVGRLFLLTAPPAIHARDDRATRTAFATKGFKMGLAETWGRAHTMRWMSTDKTMYKRQWLRVSTLEILRAIWWGVLRKPLSGASWSRLVGGVYGFLMALWKWNTIPRTAKLS